MLKTRILLVGGSALLVAALFFLPKVVVDNKRELEEEEMTTGETLASTHGVEIDASTSERAAYLRESFSRSDNKEKSTIFADSLATLFREVNKPDSAAWYFERLANAYPGVDTWKKAADGYYEAYSFAVDTNKSKRMGEKAREYYQKVLRETPADLEAKSRMAMTYLSTPEPMVGIKMLQEILEQDPENEDVNFNLGLLARQTGQTDKAIERFEKLVAVNPAHVQGRFLLAMSYLDKGKKEEARKHFELVKQLDSNPEVQATVDSYLKDIK
jgi:outer membrane protein